MRRMMIAIACLALSVQGAGALRSAELPQAAADARSTAHVDEDTVQRFITSWKSRLADQAGFQRYLDAPAIAPAILAEGFHSLDAPSRAYLISRLADDLYRHEDLTTEKLRAAKSGLYTFIFAKDEITPKEKERVAAPAASSAPRRKVVERPSMDTARIVRAATIANRTAPRTRQTLSAARVARMMGTPGGQPGRQLEDLPNPGTLRYQACWRMGDFGACGPAVPFNTPWSLNVDGVLGDDVTVAVSSPVSPDACESDPAYLASTAMQMSVTRVGLNPPANLRALIYTVFEVPGANLLLSPGFDGRVDGLAGQTVMSLAMKDPVGTAAHAALGAVDLGVAFRLAHTLPPLSWGLRIAGATLDPTTRAQRDTIDETLGFTDPSKNLRVKLEYQREGGAVRAHMDTRVYDAATVCPLPLVAVPPVSLGVTYAAAPATPGAQPDTFSLDIVRAAPSLTLDATLGNEIDLTWTGAVEKITLGADVTAAGKRWKAGATISGVPDHWNLRSRDRSFAFTTTPPGGPEPATGIGSISAWFTNHGVVTGIPTRPGYDTQNYVSVFADADANIFDGALKILKIKQVEVTSDPPGRSGADGDYLFVRTKIGGGKDLLIYGDLQESPNRLLIDAKIAGLPEEMSYTADRGTSAYAASSNTTLDIRAEMGNIGALAKTPATPGTTYHGLALRDGFGCVPVPDEDPRCGYGLKASLYLTGAPTTFQLDPRAGSFSLTRFTPTVTTLGVDAQLDDARHPDTGATMPMQMLLAQEGIPLSGVDLSFGDFESYSDVNAGTAVILRNYRSWKAGKRGDDSELIDLGRLLIAFQAQYSSQIVANLEISEIPGRVTAVITIQEDNGTHMEFDLGTGIARIKGELSYVGSGGPLPGGAELMASFTLTDVPATVDLRFGKERPAPDETAFPAFEYEGSAGTLDIAADVNAIAFGNFSGYLGLEVDVIATDLAPNLLGAWNDEAGRLVLSSNCTECRTALLSITADAQMGGGINEPAGCAPSCELTGIEYSGGGFLGGSEPFRFSAAYVIEGLRLEITDFKRVWLAPGLSSRISGDFGTFELGWDRAAIDVTFDGSARAFLRLPDFPFDGDDEEEHFTYSLFDDDFTEELVGLDIDWNLGTNHLGPWIDQTLHTPCVTEDISKSYSVNIGLRPHPHSIMRNVFQVDGAGAEGPGSLGRAWYITPSFTFLPGFVADITAAIATDVGDFSASVECWHTL